MWDTYFHFEHGDTLKGMIREKNNQEDTGLIFTVSTEDIFYYQFWKKKKTAH